MEGVAPIGDGISREESVAALYIYMYKLSHPKRHQKKKEQHSGDASPA